MRDSVSRTDHTTNSLKHLNPMKIQKIIGEHGTLPRLCNNGACPAAMCGSAAVVPPRLHSPARRPQIEAVDIVAPTCPKSDGATLPGPTRVSVDAVLPSRALVPAEQIAHRRGASVGRKVRALRLPLHPHNRSRLGLHQPGTDERRDVVGLTIERPSRLLRRQPGG
jgi:hypothetical protein